MKERQQPHLFSDAPGSPGDPIHEESAEQREQRLRLLDWCGNTFPLTIRDEAARLYHDFCRGKQSDLLEGYTSELTFGTGGLRGTIGHGAGRMNLWTVGKAALGFCRYLLKEREKVGGKHHSNGNPRLVIAYDSRRMSVEFAECTAGVAAALGFDVSLFDGVAPTPILSYAVRYLKADGGVVITASHNPPEYNGFKVYVGDGSQMAGEAQEAVETEIAAIADWGEIPLLSHDAPQRRKHVELIEAEIKHAYNESFANSIFISDPGRPEKRNLKLVYSPLHGTGGEWLPGLLARYGFEVHLVDEQRLPDSEFPTVKFPNPEEPEALLLARQAAHNIHADLFMATDPDGDRLGVGIRMSDANYRLVSGNQLGSMMIAWLAEKYAASQKQDQNKQPQIIKTIVTSELQRRIAEAHGFGCVDVLTGFKYIAEQMKYIEEGSHGYKAGRDIFLFGGEESFGYLPIDFVRDKDGLAAALLLAEMAIESGNLSDYLDQVHIRYGLYEEQLRSVTLKGRQGQERIAGVMATLRSEDLSGWRLGEREVVEILDYREQSCNRQRAPERFGGLPSADVIQLRLAPEGVLTIRPSGTEPKVKLYASLRHVGEVASLEELRQARRQLEKELVTVSGLFFARTGLA